MAVARCEARHRWLMGEVSRPPFSWRWPAYDLAFRRLFLITSHLMDHTPLTLRASAAAFFSLADSGRNGWWRYTWGVVLIVAVWLFAGGLVSPLLRLLPLGGVREFVATNVDFMLMMLGVMMVHVLVHHRPWRTLITSRPSLSWRRIFQGAALWGVLMLLMVGLESALYPGRYVWSLDPQRWPQFFVLALLLTPIQCTAEELLFRGVFFTGHRARFSQPLCCSGIEQSPVCCAALVESRSHGTWPVDHGGHLFHDGYVFSIGGSARRGSGACHRGAHRQ